MRLTEKYSEILHRISDPKPKKSADEVVEDLLRNHGITFEKGK
jgi:hypothetical protein